MVSKKFQEVASTVETLEAAAQRVARFKVNPEVSSYQTPAYIQVTALLELFRRMKINKHVTAKVGAWRKRLILTDVIINYRDTQTQVKNGEEAFELSQLMLRAMAAVKTILTTNMPGMTGYCPQAGIYDGGWRFQ